MDTGILIGFTLAMFLYGYACKRWGHYSERKEWEKGTVKRKVRITDHLPLRATPVRKVNSPHWLHRHSRRLN